jgi:Na+/proline symporter
MSTLSSSLSASASALVNDFVLPLTGHRPDQPFALRAARAATRLFAGLQVGGGISGLGGADAVVTQVLGIATNTTGVNLGLFVLALGERRPPTASLVGLCCGLGAVVFVVFAVPQLGWKLAWPWYGLVSCAFTAGPGWLVARLGPVAPQLPRT